MVAYCPNPGCAAPIQGDHPYPWCTACGERFPESLQLKLPRLREGKAQARAEKEALRSESEIEATCTNCGVRFKARAGRDFPGFQKLTCPSCHQLLTFPLKWRYRVAYWIVLCLALYGSVKDFFNKDILGLVGSLLWTIVLLGLVLRDLKAVYLQRVS